jgi:hypothetical protein
MLIGPWALTTVGAANEAAPAATAVLKNFRRLAGEDALLLFGLLIAFPPEKLILTRGSSLLFFRAKR